MLYKYCCKCKMLKDVSQFYTNKAMKDGYDNKCRFCAKETQRKLYERRKQCLKTTSN